MSRKLNLTKLAFPSFMFVTSFSIVQTSTLGISPPCEMSEIWMTLNPSLSFGSLVLKEMIGTITSLLYQKQRFLWSYCTKPIHKIWVYLLLMIPRWSCWYWLESFTFFSFSLNSTLKIIKSPLSIVSSSWSISGLISSHLENIDLILTVSLNSSLSSRDISFHFRIVASYLLVGFPVNFEKSRNSACT